MQTPERNDFSNIIFFYGTFEDWQPVREAETPHTQTRIIDKPDGTGEPGKSDCSITTKHEPHEQRVLQIHKDKAVEHPLSTETQLKYSYKQELKTTQYDVLCETTITYDDCDQTVQVIKNMTPCLTCADVQRNDNNYDDTQRRFYQCEHCEKFFSQISDYRKHLVKVVASICNTCGKRFTNHGKYLLHCLGHGDPDRECSDCRKVLANKYSLKKHRSICKKTLTRKLREFRKPPKIASK